MIRIANIKDIADVSALYRQYIEDNYPHRTVKYSSEQYRDIYQLIIEVDHADFVVLTRQGILVGFSLINTKINVFGGGRTFEVTDLFIKPEHQGNGLGAQLLHFIYSHAIEQEVSRIELCVPSSSEEEFPYTWYRSEGFETIGPLMRKYVK